MLNDLTIIKYDIKRLLIMKKNIIVLLLILYECNNWIDAMVNCIAYFDKYLVMNSKWGYSRFLTLFNELFFVLIILLSASHFSSREKKAMKITTSSPISGMKYYVLKGISVAITFLLISIIPIAYSIFRCAAEYHIYSYWNFVLPIVLFVVPAAILVLGVSMILGKINSKIPLILIPIVMFMGLRNFLDLPDIFDICGNDYFIKNWDMMRSLPKVVGGERIYSLTNEFMISRVIYVVLGIALFSLTFIRTEIKAE